ncbi:MAG: hypothetical protein KBG15_12565 [Kofleriaceae bacterium]|nr:hypothetical protein [Kofleriaceae bacterium]
MVRRGLTQMLALLALLCTIASAASRAHAERYVFEAYDGARPREADVVMPMVRRELSKTDMQADPAVLAKKFSDHQFRPGIADAAYTSERFDRDVSAGMAAWSEANFAKAAERLERALMLVRENPMLLVREIKTRNLVMRALLRLALTSRRHADTLARQPARNAQAQAKIDTAIRVAQERHKTALAELIRSYGKAAITAEAFGAEAAEQFRDAVVALQSQGTGQMLVTASDPSLTTYLNEQYEPNLLGRVRANVAPGVYRVLVQARDRETREYSITVVANTLTQLDIQMTADNLFTVEKWVGFHDVGSAAMAEGELASAMLKLQLPQTEVVLVSVVPNAAKVAVYGTKYQVPTGRLICRGFVELDSATVTKTNGDRLVQLVAFLRGGNDDPLRAVTVEKDSRGMPAGRPGPRQSAHGEVAATPRVVDLPAAKPVLAAVAVKVPPRADPPPVNVTTKIDPKPERAALARPATPTLPAADLDEPTADEPTGVAMIQPAAVAPTAPRGGRLAGKILVGGGALAVLVGAGLVAIDEDPTGGGQAAANPTYRDSALPGVITMSAGAVSVGVGVWLWARSGNRAITRPGNRAASTTAAMMRPGAAPWLAATNSQVVLGWTGSF